ncbi:MAG: FAD:protein FMN transferase [Chromatiales bacterium]|jgi:thiamine biosynthesis lipoprotein|nr:MAG: FAD:protein FMN transferase [Chromatiales bacterium]
MGSPCELLTEAASAKDAEELTALVATEAWRIEDKFSRYLGGNIIAEINSANGRPIEVDEETAQLLDFAATLHQLSDGAFDITSGVLRRAWTFDGGDRIPADETVTELLHLVGWKRCEWQAPVLQLPQNMEIDLGGIGKEYAVDRAVLELRASADIPCLVNFGGDLAITGPPQLRNAWSIGIEGIELDAADKLIELRQGAIATSGDARRFVRRNGIRYGHVIDPRTGWPVSDAASSITVAADTCTQAGTLATLAMLRGRDAEQFLDGQAEQYWCRR